jgi:hypothetical protein
MWVRAQGKNRVMMMMKKMEKKREEVEKEY